MVSDVFPKNYTKHINTMCVQNAVFLYINSVIGLLNGGRDGVFFVVSRPGLDDLGIESRW